MRSRSELGDAVCLSTCNRTELYLATADADDGERSRRSRSWRASRSRSVALPDARRGGGAAPLPRLGRARLAGPRRERDPRPGARRVRRRHRPGRCSTGCSGRRSSSASGCARETAIGESPASVPSAAAALAAQVFGDLAGRKVLLVGAGRIGELAARNLARARRHDRATSPTEAPSRGRARRPFGGAPIDARRCRGELGDVDVVLTSTSAPDVLERGDVPPARHRCFFIDIAVPRDVDPAVHELDGCFLYDIDDLEAVVSETLAGRRGEAERAEAARRAGRRSASASGRRRSTSCRRSRRFVRTPRRSAQPSCARRSACSEARRRRAARVESVTAQILNKLLHLPTVRMKQAAVAADGVTSEAVRTCRSRRGDADSAADGVRCRCRCRPHSCACVLVARRDAATGAARSRRADPRRQRGSRLALTQAELAAARLRAPGDEIALVPITTAGDRDRSKPVRRRSGSAASSSRSSRRRCSPAASTSPCTRRRT